MPDDTPRIPAPYSPRGLPPWLPHPTPGEPPSPTHRCILHAYRLELGADEAELPEERFTSFVEAVRWWNSGAPELGNEPSPAGEQLARLNAHVAAGGDAESGWATILEQQHRAARLARAMPRPDRPGWRAPRSKHAPEVEA